MPNWKMRDFNCTKCDVTFEAMAEDNEAPACPRCKDSEFITRAAPSIGGYKINGDNSASITPRGSAAFKRST